MDRKLIFSALASAAILYGGQALAAAGPVGVGGGPGGGGGHGGGMGDHGGGGAGMGNMGAGAAHGDEFGAGMGAMNRDDARLNSQGPEHASATGIAHANENSVLAGTTPTNRVASGPLSGVSTGMNVLSNGTLVGTVQQIRLSGNGNVALVLVKGTNGGIFPVPANKLTLANGTLSTTARFHGINDNNMAARMGQNENENEAQVEARDADDNDAAMNRRMNSQGPAHASATGIAHANSHSVLAGASTTTPLTGVSVGMPLLKNGVQVGTVSRVVTGNGMVRRVLVQGTNGRTFSLSPNTLTASGGTLITTAPLRGI
ncbi:MAG: hypothetical protein HOP95_00485 [Sphingomonas sp.]|nr:hypothetical protein [Sphingomonas sp.]